jgi:hypothetical protein
MYYGKRPKDIGAWIVSFSRFESDAPVEMVRLADKVSQPINITNIFIVQVMNFCQLLLWVTSAQRSYIPVHRSLNS